MNAPQPAASRSLRRILSNHPLLLVALPLALGIGVGEWGCAWLSESILGILCLFAVAVVAAFLLSLPRSVSGIRGFSFLATFSLAVCLLGVLLQVSVRRELAVAWSSDAVVARAQVVDAPRRTPRTWQVVAELCDGEAAGKKVKLALALPDCSDTISDCSDTLRCGDMLHFRAVVRTPRNAGNPGEFDYATWLRRRGVSGDAYCGVGEWKRIPGEHEMTLQMRMLRLRDVLAARYVGFLEGNSLGILTALTLGDRSRLDRAVSDLFSQGGVSHVLALSGLHLSILFGLYRLLVLNRLRRRSLFIALSLLGVSGLWAYTFLAGLPLSLVRSAWMFTVMLLAEMFRRNSFPLNNLAFAAIAVLLVSPQSLFDVGFQLSCLSVLSIVLFLPLFPCPERMKGKALFRTVYDLTAVSLAAQIGTAPLVAWYFHSFSTYGLLANLLIVPLGNVALVFGMAFLVIPFGRSLMAFGLDALLGWMESILSWISRLPGASLSAHLTLPTLLWMYLSVLLLLLCLLRRRPLRLGALAVAVIASVLSLHLDERRAEAVAPQIVFYNHPRLSPVLCVASADSAWLWTPPWQRADSLLPALRCSLTEKAGLPQPQLLQEAYASPTLRYVPGLLVFGRRVVALPSEHLPLTAPDIPLNVDCLYLTGYAVAPLSRLLLYYRPQRIVLSSALPSSYREQCRAEAAEHRLPVHDIREEGALVLPLPL